MAPRVPERSWASVLVVAAVACGGDAKPLASATVEAAPATVSERMLAMLPPGAQVVIEIDLARLRANPVVGPVVTRALAERVAALPAGVPASPLGDAAQVVLAAYGVGTAQAVTLTLLSGPHELAGTTRIADGFYAVGPPDWVDQAQQRVALAHTGEAQFAIRAAPALLALRGHAMPDRAPGAALRLTAQLPFDARIALARQTGLDAAPAQVSAWADVADDLALIVDCDAADPGDQRDPRHPGDAPRRLEATLRGALSAIEDLPAVRMLGLPASLDGAKLVTRGTWVRAIIAIGPAHLQRVVGRATTLLDAAAPAPSPPSGPASTPPKPPAAAPQGDRSP